MAIIRASLEENLVRYAVEQMSPLFHIKQEVWGTHIRGKRKRIDMVIYPKQELIENDFPKIPIGVELKTNILVDGNKKQIVELYHQAISYRHTRFELKNGNHFLPMILIYPPMQNFLKDESPDFKRGFQYVSSRLAGKYFIAELFLERDCEYKFKIDLCGATYYRFNGTGKRLNMNWGFERYEEEKLTLQRLNLNPEEYEHAINVLSDKLGL